MPLSVRRMACLLIGFYLSHVLMKIGVSANDIWIGLSIRTAVYAGASNCSENRHTPWSRCS